MNYYLRETSSDADTAVYTAGNKARDDVEKILQQSEFAPLELDVLQQSRKKEDSIKKAMTHWCIYKKWLKKISALSKGDTLLIQFPCAAHTLFLYDIFNRLHQKKVTVILLIHDLDMLRFSRIMGIKTKVRTQIEEYACLKKADYIICHNSKMAQYLIDGGINAAKVISLEIFDYLIPTLNTIGSRDKNKVVIAGNLSAQKVGYAYSLPPNINFELYGISYTGPQNEWIAYHGPFPPDDLPNVMDGGFGLVWDGTSPETCTGLYGDYLKINNPHKTSLYLASGIPVFIWKDAALADFVLENQCGIAIGSLREIYEILNSLSAQEYNKLKGNAELVGKRLRKGFYTQKAISKCVSTIR